LIKRVDHSICCLYSKTDTSSSPLQSTTSFQLTYHQAGLLLTLVFQNCIPKWSIIKDPLFIYDVVVAVLLLIITTQLIWFNWCIDVHVCQACCLLFDTNWIDYYTISAHIQKAINLNLKNSRRNRSYSTGTLKCSIVTTKYPARLWIYNKIELTLLCC